MKPALVDSAIESCQQHLDKTNSRGSEIEAFLTRYLLILICASFEEEIEAIVIRRLSSSKDLYVEAFAKSALGAVFRSLKTSEIAGMLNRFGPDYKEKFRELVNGTRAETYFNNLVAGRHYTAHNLGANVTLRELVEFYEEGHTVLDAVQEACKIGVIA